MKLAAGALERKTAKKRNCRGRRRCNREGKRETDEKE
jgi:hypothetical protein